MLLQQLDHGALSTISSSHSSRCQPTVPVRTLAHSRPTMSQQHQHGISGSATHGKADHFISSGSGTSSSRAAGVVCRNRPMWARGSAEVAGGGDMMGAEITKEIMACDTLAALSDVYNEWGGRFGHIQAAAALVKYSKLIRRGRNSPLFSGLTKTWLRVLPDAELRGCANVLYAVGKLGKAAMPESLWEQTWSAGMQRFKKNLGHGDAGNAQQVPNVLWAAVKLGKQPVAGEVQLLVQIFLQPEVLAAATAQGISNVAWALSQLFTAPGWQGGVTERDVKKLLGEQQLRVVANGTPQNASNLLIALAGIASGDTPLIGQPLAQHISRQLLDAVSTPVSQWGPQQIANTMWATAELRLPSTAFLTEAVGKAAVWVPNSISRDLTQAASACALLQHKDEVFLALLLQRASQLLQQQLGSGKAHRGKSRVMSAADKASLAALLAESIMQLDMQQLAGSTRKLVASSGVGQDANTHPSNLRRLWVFHSRLLQHQLLDGKGLTGILTEQQLQQGKHEAAVFGTGIHAAQ